MKLAELQELADDIKINGLQQPIRTFLSDRQYVVDGRNRLDAMELVGIKTIGADGCLACSYGPIRDGEDPAAYVISANIKRRHLTKKQQASLIVKAVQAGAEFINRGKGELTDQAKSTRSVNRNSKGQVQGSTKDPVKEQVVEEAAKHGISERTARQALVDAEPERKQTKSSKAKRTSKQPTKSQMAKADQAATELLTVAQTVKRNAKGLTEIGLKKLDKVQNVLSEIYDMREAEGEVK